MKYRYFRLVIVSLVFSLCLFIFKINAEDNTSRKQTTIDPYIGRRFYDITKLIRGKPRSSPLIDLRKSNQYKIYPSAKKIKLPDVSFEGLSLEQAIKIRRSKRQEDDFSGDPVDINQLSQLLFAASGITKEHVPYSFRAAPSAGGLYPIEIYLVVNNVSELEKGIYHYSVTGHALELIKEGDFTLDITRAVMDQPGIEDSSVVFVFTAIPNRTTKKYDLRGWRYIYMEVGYISENIYLQATSLGLSTTAMGAFYDDELNKLLGLDGKKEMALHLQILGNKDDKR